MDKTDQKAVETAGATALRIINKMLGMKAESVYLSSVSRTPLYSKDDCETPDLKIRLSPKQVDNVVAYVRARSNLALRTNARHQDGSFPFERAGRCFDLAVSIDVTADGHGLTLTVRSGFQL